MNKVKEFFIKAWGKITESKLNMGMFIAGAVAFVLLVTIFCVIIFRGDGIDNTIIVTKEGDNTQNSADASTEKTTSSKEDESAEEFSTKIDESETKNLVTSAGLLQLKTTIQKSWVDDGEKYVQYSIEITNVSGKDIDSWAMVLDMSSSYELVDSWNFNFKEGYKKLVINPTNSNKSIKDGEKVKGGFILKEDNYVYINYYTAYIGNKVETLRNSNTFINEEKTTNKEETTTKKKTEDETTTIKNTEHETETEKPTEEETSTEIETSETTEEPTTDSNSETTTPNTEPDVPEETTTPERPGIE